MYPQLLAKEKSLAVIGLGYVGLPLSLQFARSGVTVLGLDIDSEKVDALLRSESYIKHISAESVREQVEGKRRRTKAAANAVPEVSELPTAAPTQEDQPTTA